MCGFAAGQHTARNPPPIHIALRIRGIFDVMNFLADPNHLAPLDDEGLLQVVLETPAGTSNKVSYDPERSVFVIKKLLPAGMTFPHDFGFLPQTRGGDGDPLDVLVLMEGPGFPGCIIPSRLIGAFEAEQ